MWLREFHADGDGSGGDRRIAESPQPFELGPDDVVFDRRLRSRIHMLIVASAAGTEVPAARRDTIGGGLRTSSSRARHQCAWASTTWTATSSPGKCKGDEDHSAVRVAAEGIASVGHAFQPEVMSFQGGWAWGEVGHGSWGAGRARVPGAGRAILSAAEERPVGPDRPRLTT